MLSGNDHVSIYKRELGTIKQIKMVIKRSSDLALTECVVSLTNWPFDHAGSNNKSKNKWFLNGRGPYIYVLQPTGLIRLIMRMKAHNTVCLLLYRIEVLEERNQDLTKRWVKRLCWRLIPTFNHAGSNNKSKNKWFLNGRGPYIYVLQPTGLIRLIMRMKAHNTVCLLLYRIEVLEERNQDLTKRWVKRLCWRLIPTFKAYGYYLPSFYTE